MDSDQNIDDACIYDLTIGSVFQDEGPYLREWIEFHKMLGVQHFILVNDRSTDNFLDELQPYIDAGEVELFNHPCPKKLRGKDWIQYQLAVINSFFDYLLGLSRWLALIDVDEFIVPTETSNLVEFLNNHEDYGGIYIRWDPFGTSHVKKISNKELLTERLCLKWKFKKGQEMLGKSIVKPHRVLRPNIHSCELLPGYQYFDSNPRMENEFSKIKINHYWARDEYFLFKAKLPRTSKIKGWELDKEKIEFFKHLFNEVPDYSMKRFIPELRKRVFPLH